MTISQDYGKFAVAIERKARYDLKETEMNWRVELANMFRVLVNTDPISDPALVRAIC